jgi:hypothetical protein
MQKQPPIATVHHRNTKTHKATRAIAQFMGDPISLRNGIGAKQRSSNFAVSRAVETAIKGAQGEDEPVSADLGKRRWVWARTATVERAPKAQRSDHSDFEEPIEWQKNRRWIYAATVQMHSHLDSEALDDIPRLWACQPKVDTICAMVAPSGRRNIASNRPILVSGLLLLSLPVPAAFVAEPFL